MYIIYAHSIDQFYIGSCEDIDARLLRHNNSGSKSTKKAGDWVLKYQKRFQTRSEAVLRELEIKKKKSRKLDYRIERREGFREGDRFEFGILHKFSKILYGFLSN